MEKAAIYYDARMAGILSRTDSGFEFVYDAGYLKDPKAMPVSLSLPLTDAKYESPELFPFFEGLLPEGWLLDITSAAARIDKENKFDMLLHIGGDALGAVSIRRLPEDSK